ncbi:hypothetical protein ACS0TY_017565 [Phlomoides rotata]
MKMVKSVIKTWKKENGTSMSKEIEEIEEKLLKLHTKLECEDWEEEDRTTKKTVNGEQNGEEQHFSRQCRGKRRRNSFFQKSRRNKIFSPKWRGNS